jgi:hypothetical protein
VPFFGSFLGKQKRTRKNQAAIISYTAICKCFSVFIDKNEKENFSFHLQLTNEPCNLF